MRILILVVSLFFSIEAFATDKVLTVDLSDYTWVNDDDPVKCTSTSAPKLCLIKIIKNFLGLGLQEAKNFVDQHQSGNIFTMDLSEYTQEQAYTLADKIRKRGFASVKNGMEEKKRIYTLEEATAALGKNNKNTFKLKYR